MADRPLLFQPAMAGALWRNEKSETRRLLTPESVRFFSAGPDGHSRWRPTSDVLAVALQAARDFRNLEGDIWTWTAKAFAHQTPAERTTWLAHIAPAAGDRLWVRENWTARMTGGWTIADARSRLFQEGILYQADGEESIDGWWPSIHLPREFSRQTLVVKRVRIERLQDITDVGARYEGATARAGCAGFLNGEDGWSMDWSLVGRKYRGKPLTEADVAMPSARLAFADYFNRINGPETWKANPFVRVISFEHRAVNIDRLRAA